MGTPAILSDCYQLSRPADTTALATELADFIKAMGLSTSVQGKEFVNVEGWQYAGSRLGIVPIMRSTTDLSFEENGAKIIRFEARVELFDLRSQQVIGAGEAECDNTESGKKFYARYAIKSMAQTRAVGKAYRLLLGWIIKAAGYQPTPSEEMHMEPETHAAVVPPALATDAQKNELRQLLDHESVSDEGRDLHLAGLHTMTGHHADKVLAGLKRHIRQHESCTPEAQ